MCIRKEPSVGLEGMSSRKNEGGGYGILNVGAKLREMRLFKT